MKRLVKFLTFAAVIVAVAALLKRRPAPPSASPTAPPTPVAPKATTTSAPAEPATAPPAATGGAPWAEPNEGGGCPEGYPVKAKVSSSIFHVPGGVLYDRTGADRCYASPEAAEADGFRASLR
jgi:hypothetical protein